MSSGGRRQRLGRAPAAATGPPRRSPRSGKTPSFAYLIRGGLESIGVHYVSVDLLRRAKKNLASEREYWALWRLLHDVVLVVLADFQVDVLELERLNSPENLENGLLDPAAHHVQMELVRFYLYDWGFVCASFYASSGLPPDNEREQHPPSSILLLALAWLLAFSNFFERQHQSILQRYMDTTQLRLPPFPNDVDLDGESVRNIILEAAAASTAPATDDLSLEAQINQLHSAFGRLQNHLNDLQTSTRYYQRLLERLKEDQDPRKTSPDEALPAYVVQLLAGPTNRLTAQVQLLTQSVQMLEDEALFYKWINGLVLSTSSTSPVAQVQPTSPPSAACFPELQAQIQEVQTLFQHHESAFQHISQCYTHEWKAWKARQRSRSRIQQMETKARRFVQDVQVRELLDPQKLFLRSQRSWAASYDTKSTKDGEEPLDANLVTQSDVERLQTQLESVLGEITREYCNVQLR